MRYFRQRDQVYESDVGVTARYTKALGARWNLTAALEYMDRNVRQDDGRDAHSVSGSLGFDVLLMPNLKIGADYTLMRERARDTTNSRRVNGPAVYAVWQPRFDLQLIANYSYRTSTYDRRMVFFPDAREDWRHTASLTALWDISRYTGQDMSVRAQYLYVDNPSNVGLYDYDRALFMMGLQWRF